MNPRIRSLIILLAFCTVGQPLAGQERLAKMIEVLPGNNNWVSLLDLPAGLRVEAVPLSLALTQLGTTTGVSIAFSPSLLPPGKLVSCDCEAATVKEALDHLLAETGLRYTLVGKQVVVEEAFLQAPKVLPGLKYRGVPAAALLPSGMMPRAEFPSRRMEAARQSTGTIVGRVIDAQNREPLAGTQVSIPVLGIGTLASGNGRFNLAGVPEGTHIVSIQRIGYGTAEHTVQVPSGGSVELEVALRQEIIQLEGIVVTGTGREVRTREMGTSVSQVRSADFLNAPVRNPEEILMGRQPGVTVQLRSGQPGAMGHIILRGATSVSAARNQPLIYVDGVRLFNEGIQGAQNTRQGVHALQSVAAGDIERIEIVRGAAASTLYGSEAGAGVIQIFTKQGVLGAPVWEVGMTAGVNHLGRVGPSSDPTSMYLKCGGEMVALARNTWQPITMRDPTCPPGGSWLEPGALWNVSASVRGGVSDFRYSVSARRGYEEGVIKPGSSENGGVRGNFEFAARDDLTFSFGTAYSKGEVRWLPDGDRGVGFLNNVTRGTASVFQDPAECAALGLQADNCLVNYRVLSGQVSHQWTDHFTLGGTARWEPRPTLNHRVTVGYDFIESNGQEIQVFGFHRAGRELGRLINRDQQRITLTMDYVGSWSRNELFGRDIGSAFSWGFQFVEENRQDYWAQADDFAKPPPITMTDAAGSRITRDDQIRVINPGLFLQESMSFNDRMFVTLGARIDGHSAFGRDFGLQAYPKLGFSYVLSEHLFWPSDLLQTFRVRGAIGVAGQAPGAFDATRMWMTLPGPAGLTGFTPDVLGNENLGPERTREIELGFEGSTLQDRLGVDMTFYWQDTHDALVGVQPIPSLGFLSRQLENIGHIRNRGFEVEAKAELVRTLRLAWMARAHFSRNRSEAVDLGGEIGMSSQLQQIREGAPVPSFYGPKLLNPNEFEDPIYSEQDEYLGSPWPVNLIGVGTTIRVGQGITLDAQGEFQGGHLVYNSTGQNMAAAGTWQPCFDIQMALAAGDQATLSKATARERARCAISGAARDPRQWLEPGDFFKLRVASLTYAVPQRWLRGVDRATVTLSGRNLFTLTDYSGLSVEANQGGDVNVMTRRDHMQIPPYRTFQLSMRMVF